MMSAISNFRIQGRQLFKCYLKYNKISNPIELIFKQSMMFCSDAKKCLAPMKVDKNNLHKAVGIYNIAMNIDNDDDLITAEDLINKGFAYLNFNEFAWSARQCFILAKRLDSDKKYQAIIECGMIQTRKVPNDNPCMHAVPPLLKNKI